MQQMNKVMDPQKMAAQMNEFTKQSMQMGMTEEMSELSLIDSLADLSIYSFIVMVLLWYIFNSLLQNLLYNPC